jgi:hypothetical protein
MLGHFIKEFNKKKITFVFIALTLIFSNFLLVAGIYRQLNELRSRAEIGVGLTDEAFGILHTMDRGSNGQTGHTPLFADVTSILLRLVAYDVTRYRIAGYFILITISLIICWRIYQLKKLMEDKSTIAWACLSSLLLVLLLPTSFRFLLVTPSYQWIALTSSFILFFLLSQLNDIELRKDSYILFFASIFVFFIELARFSSGFAVWLLISGYIYKRVGFKKTLIFNSFLISINAIYLTLYHEAFLTNLKRLLQLPKIDPIGANLVNEFWDVGKSSILVYLLITVSINLTSLVFQPPKENDSAKKNIRPVTVVQTLVLIFLFQLIGYREFVHLVAYLTLIICGILIGLSKQKSDSLLLYLAMLPIVSQFGSNISASYLVMPMISTGFLYLFLSSTTNRPTSSVPSIQYLSSFCYALISFSLFFLQANFSTTSYENGYGSSSFKKDQQSRLIYASEKMQNIATLRDDVDEYIDISGLRILDLSNWHPGVIYYLNAMQFPISTVDKVFNSTLRQQVYNTLNQEELQRIRYAVPIIIESKNTSPKLTCQRLFDYTLDPKLDLALGEFGFNPKVIEIGIYKSVPEDLTLYPKNISVMIPCDD